MVGEIFLLNWALCGYNLLWALEKWRAFTEWRCLADTNCHSLDCELHQISYAYIFTDQDHIYFQCLKDSGTDQLYIYRVSHKKFPDTFFWIHLYKMFSHLRDLLLVHYILLNHVIDHARQQHTVKMEKESRFQNLLETFFIPFVEGKSREGKGR